MTRIEITWFDGSRTSGDTWEEVETALRAAQWIEYDSRLDFRRDLRHRAKTWSGVRPSLLRASSEQFLRALETSGMCRIDTTDDQISTDQE